MPTATLPRFTADFPSLGKARNVSSSLPGVCSSTAAIVDKVAADVKEAVSAPDVREKLIAQGAVPQASTPAELQRLIDADKARYGRIIREQGLKAE